MTLAEAQAALAALEKPRHDHENANVAYQRALLDGDADKITAAHVILLAATAARTAANVHPKDIDRAAQAVVDAREAQQ